MAAFIQDVSTRDQFTAAAGQTIFDYTFPIFDEIDLVVQQILVSDPANPLTLTLNVDYTVTGVNIVSGGTIILTSSASVGDTIIIFRDVEKKRITDFSNTAAFNADNINLELNRIVQMTQDRSREIQQTLRIPDSDINSPANILSNELARADKMLSFDVNGQPISIVKTGDVQNLISALGPDLVLPDLPVVANFAAMTALLKVNLTDGDTVFVKNRTLPKDNGGDIFEFIEGDTTTQDFVNVFETDEGGDDRWHRSTTSTNMKDGGAVEDGTTDDSTEVQRTMDTGIGLIQGTGDQSKIDVDLDLVTDQTLFSINFKGDAALVELVRFVDNTKNNSLISCSLDLTASSAGLSYHLNKTNCLNNMIALTRMKSDGYAVLIDAASDNNDGFINIGNFLFSETRDAIEYNSPDFLTNNYVTVGNVLETGVTGPSPIGFGYGHAATRYYVFSSSVIKFSRSEAIHIEDEQRGGVICGISVKETKDHGLYIQQPVVAQGQAAADPVVTVGTHMTHTGTKTGFNGFNMAFLADPYIPALGSTHVMKGFDAGYFLSGTDGFSMMTNSIAKDCNIGVFVKSRHTHVGTIHCENCPTLAKGGPSARIGKVISNITPTTILDVETNFPGAYMAGFLFPKSVTHTGSGVESFDLFDLEDLTHGKLSLHFHQGSGFFFVADITWDGGNFAQLNKEVRAAGSVTNVNVVNNAGTLAVEITSASAISAANIIVDFDGRYMKFTI